MKRNSRMGSKASGSTNVDFTKISNSTTPVLTNDQRNLQKCLGEGLHMAAEPLEVDGLQEFPNVPFRRP